MRAHPSSLLTLVLTAAAAGAPALLAAQSASAARTVADRVYSAAQADRGEQRFKASCSSCHTPDSFSGAATDRWSGQTLGEVFDYVSNNMPENDPGGLKPDDYANVLAFMLRVNNYPAGDTDLPADATALKQIAIDVPAK